MTETSQENAHPLQHLIDFMNGPDSATLRRLLSFFSVPRKYVQPEELKEFWESLSSQEKNYYHRLVALREI
jgi:hypothetical protein